MVVTPMHFLYPTTFHVIFVAFKWHWEITQEAREEAPVTLPNSKHLS